MRKIGRVALSFYLMVSLFAGGLCGFLQTEKAFGAASEERSVNAETAKAYLNKLYKEEPLGTMLRYAGNRDREILTSLASRILQEDETKPQTVAEKAESIAKWVYTDDSHRNIRYVPLKEGENAGRELAESAIDTFLNREGRCFGYAQLISQLLRTQSIPAVVAVGSCSQTECADSAKIKETGEKHAWVYLYDREKDAWLVCDPINQQYGASAIDAPEIISHYYLEEMEGVTPDYEGRSQEDGIFYQDGKFYVKTGVQKEASSNTYVRKSMFAYYRPSVRSGNGTLQTGWIDKDESGNPMVVRKYADENGILRMNDILEESDGSTWYCNSYGTAVKISGLENIRLRNGMLTVRKGERFEINPFRPGFEPGENQVIYYGSEGLNAGRKAQESAVTIDETGHAAAERTGVAVIHFALRDVLDDQYEDSYFSRESILVNVIDADETENYSDSRYWKSEDEESETEEHEHEVIKTRTVPAVINEGFETESGEIIGTCSCGEELLVETIPEIEDVELSETAFVYDGKEKKPEVTVTCAGMDEEEAEEATVLEKGKDYTVAYQKNPVQPGAYQMKILFRGNYQGTLTLEYWIFESIDSMAKKLRALGGKNDYHLAEAEPLGLRQTSSKAAAITLSWDTIEDASAYYLFRRKCGNQEGYTQIASIKNPAQSSYTDKNGIANGSYYRYILVAEGEAEGKQIVYSVSKSVHAVSSGVKRGYTGKTVTPAQKNKSGKIQAVCACGTGITIEEIPKITKISLARESAVYKNKELIPQVSVTGKDASGKTRSISANYYDLSWIPKEIRFPGTYQVILKFKGNYKGTEKMTWRIYAGTVGTIEKKLKKLKKESDLTGDGAEFHRLKLWIKAAKQNAVTLKWEKMPGASGYDLYMKSCDDKKNGYRKVKSIASGNTVSVTIKKGLKKKHYYKFILIARRKENGTNQVLGISWSAHAFTAARRDGMSKQVVSNKKTLTLQAGDTATIEARVSNKLSKKQKKHGWSICYESSNGKVVSVNRKNGSIRGIRKGTATIYCYAKDGKYTTVKVTVLS